MQFENTIDFALQLDQSDELNSFRKKFLFPEHNGKKAIYFCGNSLGLQPATTREYVNQELTDWEKFGVEGHFQAQHPWYPYHEFLRDNMAKVVGALPKETVVMNSLTANVHFMLVSFYRPNTERYKIICEASAFPSDQYALQSQVKFHGFNPKDAIIELKPREGEFTLRHEDIIASVEKHKDSLALVFLGNPNYYTGQVFQMKEITEAAHRNGALAGFDLAHGAGNLELHLHDWQVDFAVWCSYKYLNSGPGGVAGAFVHEKHCNDTNRIRFAGWWGNDPETRFTMPHDFVPVKSADSWQLSNAPVLPMASLRASLEIFAAAGIEKLVAKRKKLNDYLRYVIKDAVAFAQQQQHVTIITPENENERGAQVSMICKRNGKKIFNFLTENGIIADWREPEVLRMAAVPLYNSFEDVFRFGECFKQALVLNK
jgi:kynureninase